MMNMAMNLNNVNISKDFLLDDLLKLLKKRTPLDFESEFFQIDTPSATNSPSDEDPRNSPNQRTLSLGNMSAARSSPTTRNTKSISILNAIQKAFPKFDKKDENNEDDPTAMATMQNTIMANNVNKSMSSIPSYLNNPSGRKKENRPFNRFSSILPYEHSRVRLKTQKSDYVNAKFHIFFLFFSCFSKNN